MEIVPILPINSPKNGRKQSQNWDSEPKKNLSRTNKESKSKFSFKTELENLGADHQLVEDWMTVRNGKGARNTKTAFEGFIREFQKSNLPINTVLRICIEKNWSGFSAAWLEKINLCDYQEPKTPNLIEAQLDYGDW